MKKFLAAALCAALMLATLTASAAPMMEKGGYTAYLGTENHLYLRDPLGEAKALRMPIADILAATDTHVYVKALDGSLLSITLDGTQTAVVTELPADTAAAPRYELADSLLHIVKSDGSKLFAAANVILAASNETQLFYLQLREGKAHLMALPLENADSLTLAPIARGLMTLSADTPLSLTASAEAAVIVEANHWVTVWSIASETMASYPAISDQTAMAVYVDGQLIRYAQSEDGAWVVEAEPLGLSLEPVTNTNTPTLAPTASPTVKPARTAAPTATPKAEETYPELTYGDTGSDVRAMQRRLKKLGYPVGNVDGDWRDNTQLAVNLFQNAAGYKERNKMTAKMQEKLYSSSAPKYDQFKSLKEGAQGTPVRLMQQALYDLGYFGLEAEAINEVDGYYGPKTAEAVKAFQQEIVDSVEDFDDAIQPTGKADRATLKVLFGTMAPMAPAAKPTARPTEPLVELVTRPPQTEQPDETTPPVEDITPPPSEEPDDKPSEEPTVPAEPTDDLVESITPPPADESVDLILPGGN